MTFSPMASSLAGGRPAMGDRHNIVYYSALDNPEAFDVLDRMITVSQTEQDDELTGLASFKDALYVFKRNSIYVIMKKPDGTYGRYLINMGVGCVAPWSIIEANDLLMFLSHRGIELYNGTTFYSFNFSTPVQPDLDLVDTSKYELVTSSHNRPHGEVWFNFPDVTGENQWPYPRL